MTDIRVEGREGSSRVGVCGGGEVEGGETKRQRQREKERMKFSIRSKMHLLLFFSNKVQANNLLMFLVDLMPYIGQQHHHTDMLYLNFGNLLTQQSQPCYFLVVGHKICYFGYTITAIF